MSETRQQRYWRGRQAGTTFQVVRSWAHELTRSTDVFWNNTGVDTEHTQVTVQAEDDRSPPFKGDLAGLRSLNPTPRGGALGPLIAEWSSTFLPEDVSLKARPEKKKKQPKKTGKKKIQYNHTGIRIGGKTFFFFL